MKDIRLEEEATFDNVLRPIANNENSSNLLKKIIGFYQYVSEDKDLRDASSTAEKELEVMLLYTFSTFPQKLTPYLLSSPPACRI